MKQIDQILIGIIIIASPFLLSFFLGNYTATAIGLLLVGVAATIKMFEQKAKSRAMVWMWIAIIILIIFLLGLVYLLPLIFKS